MIFRRHPLLDARPKKERILVVMYEKPRKIPNHAESKKLQFTLR
jgi:hypothetical protein